MYRCAEEARENTPPVYSLLFPPYEGVKIKLPLHPFALVAHFNIHWGQMTQEQRADCFMKLTDEQRRRVIQAHAIWTLWHPSTSEIAPRQDDNFSEEGSTFKDYDADRDPTDHQSRKRSRLDGDIGRSEKAKSRKYNRRQGQGQQRQAGGSATHDATLVDNATDFESNHRKCSASSDSSIIATEDEYAEESDDDYNPLPQYSKLYKIDIKAWSIVVMEGFEQLQEIGMPKLSGIDCGKRVREYAREAARAPPTGDWTQWKADTVHLWTKSLPAHKRHKLSGIPGRCSPKLAPKFCTTSPAVPLSRGHGHEAYNYVQ
jgi:hypothetical protein